MRRLFALATGVALVATIMVVAQVSATTAIGVTSKTLGTGTLPPVNLHVRNGDWQVKLQTKEDSTVTVVENDVDPGGSFGWHSHPGPSLIVVKSGTLTFYDSDDPTCSPVVHTAGDAFIDAGTDTHIGFNKGTTEAVVIVTRIIPEGAAPRIDEPAPPNCHL